MVPQLLMRLRRVPARVLHLLRRRQVRATLSGRVAPLSVLVVCHGNICRSPFGAAVLRRKLAGTNGGVRVESAGFIGPDRPCPAQAVAVAARRGVDLSTHRSKLLGADLASSTDLILVMDPMQRRFVCDRFGRLPRDVVVLGDLDPLSAETRTIRDPVEQPREVFEESYARIERCVVELVNTVWGRPAAGSR